MTKNLNNLIIEAAAITDRVAEISNQLSEIVAKKDSIVAVATGPDDSDALRQLNVLISQEQMANSQLKIARREEIGIKARLLNEAALTRKDAIDTLQKEQRRLLDRLDNKLTEFYPNARDRKWIVEHLHGGAGIRQVPALHEIGRYLTSLSVSIYNPRQLTEFQWAAQIRSLVNSAIAALEALKS